MSLVSTPPILWPGYGGYASSSSTTGYYTTLDAGTEFVWFSFAAPKAGTITKVGFITGTVTTPQSLNVGIETPGTYGRADTTPTYVSTNSYGAVASPAANTWYDVTLTDSVTVEAGEVYNLTVRSTNTANTPNLQIAYGINALYPRDLSALGSTYNTYLGTYTSVNTTDHITPVFTIEYNDGSKPWVGNAKVQVNSCSVPTIKQNTTPDEVGNKFTMPFACKIKGIMIVNNDDEIGMDVVVYDGSDNVLYTKNIEQDGQTSNAQFGKYFLFFDEITLAKNDVIRVILKPDETGTNKYYRKFVAPASADLATFTGGTSVIFTSRTDGGSWTDDNTAVTTTNILISALESGAAAPSLLPRLSLLGVG